MTFQDVMADLEALWYAALWFDPLVFPESEVQIKKCTQPGGPTGPCPLRLVEEGRFIFTPGVRAGNGSVDTA